jgi:DNA-directed RNA polymerase omega subunit
MGGVQFRENRLKTQGAINAIAILPSAWDSVTMFSRIHFLPKEMAPLQTYGKLDSKFRFVIVASKRAKQLLKGAKVKIRTKSRNPIRIAQAEVREGLIDFDILQARPEDLLETDEQVFTPDDEIDDLDGSAGAAEDDEVEEGPEAGEGEGADYDEVPEDNGEEHGEE